MKVVVGSLSEIKLAAVREALGDKAEVEGVDVESGVPPQPVGAAQTLEGARNRAREALKLRPDADMAIGIENGMFEVDDDQWVDVAMLVMLSPATEAVSLTDSLPIPADFEKGPNGEWSVHKDPHSIVTGGKRSRKDFLCDALKKYFK
jgi:inosine/xanthosine triphosphatase